MPTQPHLARLAALLATLAALAALALGTGCAGRSQAPQFAYTLLDGSPGHTQAQRGKVVLVNFWATSCAACIKEMPQLVATHRKFAGRGFETLAVAMRHDAPASVSSYAESRQLPFGVVIDNTGAIASRFGNVELTPTTFVIDKHGAIARRFVGAPDFAELNGLVEKLLAEA